eukprot:TRINITY_DN7246_c1_g1_i1.p1 TRINITY_DN7246_c1_g1~~TRINITY_DN7246_c1_g1_i1.p1  ORF type:complete len:425 (+),score=55.79 TRINITY_DN7246_c1_g1_i1:79-1353(+)
MCSELLFLLALIVTVFTSDAEEMCSSSRGLVQVGVKSTLTRELKLNSSANNYIDVELVFPKKTGPKFRNPIADFHHLRGICNPSLAILDDAGTVLVAARRLHMQWPNIPAAISDLWVSDIAMVQLPLQQFLRLDRDWSLEDYTMMPDPRSVATDANVECAPYFKYAFGPEDPKFFQYANKLYISIVGTEMVSDPLYNLKNYMERPKCTETQGFRHHIAELTTSGSGVEVRPHTLVKLETENMGTIERNWNFFTWTSPEGSHKLHAVYSVYPQVILDVDVSTGKSPRLYETNSTLLAQFASRWNLSSPGDIHSGAGVAYVANKSGSPYYISALHFHTFNSYRSELGRDYAHFLYTFSAQPPFHVTAVAKKPLPLQATGEWSWWHNETYVSSVLVHEELLIIGYGQADSSSRIYQQKLENALQKFF